MRKFINVLAVIFLIILVPILVVNCIVIVKSYVNPDKVPFVLGTATFAVVTDSMNDTIESGDLIICRTVDAKDVKVGDIITFTDPAGNGISLVTHRVTDIREEDGKLVFTTKGDANSTEDATPVPEEKVIGRYTGRLKGVGNIAMFMQTPGGILLFVVVPLLLLILIDAIRSRRYNRKKEKDTARLMAEIETLREEREKENTKDV